MVRKTPMYGTPPGAREEDLAEHHKPAAFSRIQVAALVRIGVAAFSRIARPLSTEFCIQHQARPLGNCRRHPLIPLISCFDYPKQDWYTSLERQIPSYWAPAQHSRSMQCLSRQGKGGRSKPSTGATLVDSLQRLYQGIPARRLLEKAPGFDSTRE